MAQQGSNGNSAGDAVRGDAIIWEMEPDSRRFTYVSGRAETLLGYPARRWLSEPDFWLRIVHPEDRERAQACSHDAIAHARDHELEYRVLAADGRVLWVHDRVSVVADEYGRAELLQGVMVDVTTIKAGERNVPPPKRRPAREADRIRGIAQAAGHLSAAASSEAIRRALADACRSLLPHDALALDLDGAGDSVLNDAEWSSVLRSRMVHPDRKTAELGVASRQADAYDGADQAVLDVLASLASMALGNLAGSTEAALTQRALRDSEALKALLEEITSAAIEARTFNEAAGTCLSAICAHTGWSTAHVFVRTDEGDVVSTGIWEITAQTRYRDITSVASRIRYRPGIGIVGRVLATGEPVWVPDVTRDPAFLRRSADAEVRGAFAFPVKVGGVVVAVLEFFSRDPVEPDTALIGLSHRVAGQLARVVERERAQERIRFQARLLDAVGEAVVASDAHHRVIYWNQAAEKLFGWTRAEALGRTSSELLPAHATPQQTAEITSRLATGQSWSGEFEIRHKNGTSVPVHITGSIIYDEIGSPAGYVGVATDLRESKELEQKLRQAQSLETVGRLAGGVAHDFNNLLTSIKGTILLILEDLPADSPLRRDLEDVSRAADRAAKLTAQLLAFSRRQMLLPRVVDLNVIVRDTLPTLRRLLSDRIQVAQELDPNAGAVRVDPGQIREVIVNLVANARDAMADGGRVVIRTTRAGSPGRPAPPDDLDPAAYVLLEVEDHGTGIPESDVEHIFEPFYTTKTQDPGSGLGLSTVYGIVKQSEGHLTVKSVVGEGTTIQVFLPRVSSEQVRTPTPAAPRAVKASETLLLVEDEDSVRRLARKILDRQGYTVLEASNGVEALEVFNDRGAEIDLVVSDVVMPLMSGAELMDRLRALRPELPILLMSGYTGDALGRRDLTEAKDRFLEKPFSPQGLAHKVRSVLDAARSHA